MVRESRQKRNKKSLILENGKIKMDRLIEKKKKKTHTPKAQVEYSKIQRGNEINIINIDTEL